MGGFAGANVSSIPNNRTVYLGGLPPNTSYEDVLNHVKFGPVEQVKIIEDKNCAFISFIESSAALNFYADSQAKHIQIGGMEVKVGWGKASPCPAKILAAVQSGATRNVFIGNIDETFNETGLATEFAQFGPVDQVRVLAEKRIAFVHMASVAAAMKAVSSLPTEPRYAGRRVNYGKDRCGSFTPGHGPLSPMPGPGVYGSGPFGDGFYPQSPMSGNRTVYLGGVHAEAVTKDICDVVRGGILQNVKYMPEKNIAFVKFIDPGAALAFYNRGNNEGVVIKGKRVKVGWGKPSGLPLSIAAVVQSGASRNVYIGQIDSTITEERLKRDLAEYGEIEMVNIVPDKNIAFANFTDILAAVRAVEMLRGRADYAGFKISYGKDRCGNPLRPPVPRDPNVVSGGAPPVSSAGNGAYSPTASPETAVPPPTL
ncbi:hypothetical protein DFJ73DRAFT_619984 [Zopfochytrium polystomum]|nr:hypothetical protein DFJ73DRAFT_619984 [Zopfochytrium polystomum]